jgi:hypothetical protein
MAIISPRGTCGFGPPAAIAIAVIATADAVVDPNTLALGQRGVKDQKTGKFIAIPPAGGQTPERVPNQLKSRRFI